MQTKLSNYLGINGIYVNRDEQSVKYIMQLKGLQLPEDFIKFYQWFDGTEDLDDFAGFFFYPLNELESANSKLRNADNPELNNVILFLDYLINCWWYGVRIVNECKYEILIVASENEYKVITDSLNDFIDLYLNDNNVLYDYSP
ncbi:MAG: hypothetical protein EOP46_10295 [Sphingobacteriaceae bacterium]|nr:MAG: hypothetical protein EOP46_10295 [Sphingobacteriaceae bacterium]